MEAIENLYAGKVWFKVDYMCWFKIQVERVCKDMIPE